MVSILQSVRGSRKSSAMDSIEDRLEDQIEALKAELASLSKSARERGRSEGKRLRHQAESCLDDMLSTGEDLLAELRGFYDRGEAEVRRTVRKHPLATIGAAAAVGLLIAVLARR